MQTYKYIHKTQTNLFSCTSKLIHTFSGALPQPHPHLPS